jgi:uncharacterized protein (DUF1800 family)
MRRAAARALATLSLTSALAAAALPARADDGRIVHALARLTLGARPGDVERVRRSGLDAFLARQLAPETIDDRAVETALATLPALRLSVAELHAAYPPPVRPPAAGTGLPRPDAGAERGDLARRPARIIAELQAAKMLRAVESPRQLQEVMVDFWFNHFNVHARKGELRWYTLPYERDVIRPAALGRFGDLVRGTARHPAMLFYLDNWVSARPGFTIPAGPARGRQTGLNENYARELLELHTLGVDGGYTQQDVTEVARAFTGWTIDRPRADARFVFRPRMHDTGAKVVLGHRLPAGGGEDDGERVIALLLRHPATARFVATKLVRRFVADDPPVALVERVAQAYAATDGDVRAMLRTIVSAPEFWAPEVRAVKVKTPYEFVASAVRAVGGHTDARGAFALARAAGEMGQPLYDAQAPTGYPDRAEPWVNAGALLSRMNFALALVEGRLRGVSTGLGALVTDVDRARPGAVLDRLLAAVLHDGASERTRAVLQAHLDEPRIARRTGDDGEPADTDVETVAALVLGSPEFQRR